MASNIPLPKEVPMRSIRFLMVAGVVLSLALGGAALADDHAVKVTAKDGVGKFFTDAKGMTLYVFKKDSPGKSACAGPCVGRWPLYFREMVAVTDGVKAADFGSITRDDGKRQTTYKGWPLYYFVDDKSPGETKGHGVGSVWYVANP
jgi:predicted lipoprotein with Yx(FWY)xxD motif